MNFKFQHQTEENEKAVGETFLKFMASYYNAVAGEWEPFIEKTKAHLLVDQYKGQDVLTLQFKNALNLNFTESLLKTVVGTYMNLKEGQEASKSLFE